MTLAQRRIVVFQRPIRRGRAPDFKCECRFHLLSLQRVIPIRIIIDFIRIQPTEFPVLYSHCVTAARRKCDMVRK